VGSDPIAAWNTAVAIVEKEQNIDRRKAGIIVAKSDRELHAKFLDATNKPRRRRR
jgi:hypothetical protein